MRAIDFIRGSYVEMTEEALKQNLDMPSRVRTGIVVGHSRDKQFVRVRVDGKKVTESYSPKFWRLQP